ncbi:MAG TPA: choice-of-anchor D domain-containing protein [Blastocatellia bacterium]|jgi:hypothetical protein|nr:choice-of-anchor D domain-containing protein [Blastocatellia bacterium]
MSGIMGVLLLAIVMSGGAAVQTKDKKSDSSKSKAQPQTPPAVSATPISLEFGNQVIRIASKSKRITLTNTGEKKLYINSVVVGGDNDDDFIVVHDTCTGATIDSHKSCVVDVSFTPAETGSRKGELIVTDNALDSPQRLVLTGSGINSVDVPPKRPPG